MLATMVNPPRKGLYQTHVTFWGQYKWPNPQYSRYASCEDMEKIADETRCMTQALSTLKSATELGLSLDSGLGWIQGPDISDRAELFKQHTKIFDTRYAEPSETQIECGLVWDSMKRQFFNPRRPTFQTVLVSHPNAIMPEIAWGIAHAQAVYPPLVFRHNDAEEPSSVFTQQRAHDDQQAFTNPFSSAPLIPNALTDGQIQWLLENEWAQRAFLSSFCVSLIDNATTFQYVRTLNIAKISSRYLSELKREDLWAAFPNLEKLTLAVSPDWRDIVKESTGTVTDPALIPSTAATKFYSLLEACIKRCKTITTLELGWVGGGERAVGIFARNKNILPAPVLDFGTETISVDLRCNVLTLPHVQRLTLTNCWFHPRALKQFVKKMQANNLRTLKLDSVSLSTLPGRTANAPAVNHPPGGNNALLGLYPPGPANHLAPQQGWWIPGPLLDADPDIPQAQAPPGGHVSEDDDGGPHKPPPSSCLIKDQRDGSWPEVIDKITPGRTLDYERYLHGVIPGMQNPPEPRNPGSLRRIEFVSCGYLRLTHLKNLQQDPICHVMSKPPQCLRQRARDLSAVMMSGDHDPLLGQIAPAMAKHESDTLQVAFGMRMGWEDNDLTKYETREDGQPIGGSGRFSGVVEKEEDHHMSG